jgi:predicted RNA-binding Zn-ribbon protein involved in translation (DUF1610 family)
MSVLCILVAIGLVFAGIMLVMLRGGLTRKRVQRPSCGACGYSVEGLPTFICPECGCDLRTVGIRTPSTRVPIAAGFLWGTAWTVLLPISAFLITTILVFAGAWPTNYVHNESSYLRPKSGNYVQLQMHATADRLVWGARRVGPPTGMPTTNVTLRWVLHNQAQPTEVDWRPADRVIIAVRNGDPNAVGHTLDADWLVGWYAQLALDPNLPANDREIDAVVKLTQAGAMAVPQADPNVFGSTTSTWNQNSDPYGLPYILGFWFVAWLAGLIWIIRANRRRLPADAA